MSEEAQSLESMSQAIWYNNWTLSKFQSFIKGDILEIGCGIGNFTKYLEKYGSVYAIDIDKNYINQTKKKVDNVVVGLGNLETGDYFFKPRKFDTIICLNVLEHIKNDSVAIKNIHKLLKPTGHLILLIPSHPSLYGQIDRAVDHYRRYDKKKITSEIKSMGFEIIQSKRLNFLGALGWWFTGKILKENTIRKDKIKIFNIFGPVFLALEKLIEPPLGTSILIIAKKQ